MSNPDFAIRKPINAISNEAEEGESRPGSPL
jgi:hypothetical protein